MKVVSKTGQAHFQQKSARILHLKPASVTMLLSSLRASLASQQPDSLIQGSLWYARTGTSNHPR